MELVEFAATKAALAPVGQLVRDALAGALLGFVSSLAFLMSAETGRPVAGALLFPAGFVLITLLASRC